MTDISPQLPDLTNDRYQAFLFDMDGVLTDTASIHAAAWKVTFDIFLQDRANESGEPFVPFDIATDYPGYVDGKPRNAGVRDFLVSRGVTLPEGEPTDPGGDETVWAVGNRKNDSLVKVLEEQGVEVYPGTLRLLEVLKAAGKRFGVVSSSANTAAVLKAGGISDLFETRVDGVSIIQDGLKGKPAPDTFVEAARRLGVDVRDTVVFEDALAGVAAGAAGGFGLVIGVDRVGQAAALLQNGADVVVQDLAELVP